MLSTMPPTSSVQSSCDFLLNSVRCSGLNYSCQETPFSIFLNLRKSFIKHFNPITAQVKMEHEVFHETEKKLHEDKESLQKAFSAVQSDYNDAISECQSSYKVIEELQIQNSNLHEKLAKAETIVKNLEHKIKVESKDKKNVEDKNDKNYQGE